MYCLYMWGCYVWFVHRIVRYISCTPEGAIYGLCTYACYISFVDEGAVYHLCIRGCCTSFVHKRVLQMVCTLRRC